MFFENVKSIVLGALIVSSGVFANGQKVDKIDMDFNGKVAGVSVKGDFSGWIDWNYSGSVTQNAAEICQFDFERFSEVSKENVSQTITRTFYRTEALKCGVQEIYVDITKTAVTSYIEQYSREEGPHTVAKTKNTWTGIFHYAGIEIPLK